MKGRDAMPTDPSTSIALGSLTTALLACLIWVIKHVFTVLIPEMQRAHAASIQALCERFEKESQANRELTMSRHADLVEHMQKMVDTFAHILETGQNGTRLRAYRAPDPDDGDGPGPDKPSAA
jgi:hypothetical protein